MSSRPVIPPTVNASTFVFEDSAAQAAAVRDGPVDLYTRWSNPTVRGVEARIAALEGAERALLTASGMAAIHLALLPAALSGSPILVQNEVYGGTHELLDRVLRPLGAKVRRTAVRKLATGAEVMPRGATVYCEMPTNPSLDLVDLPAIRARAPHVRVVLDATFATPINLQGLAHGADVVVHSATKYLGGHHDLTAGVVAGSRAEIDALWPLRKLLGPTLDPSAAARLGRGLDTLGLRVGHQNRAAAELAARLAAHASVGAVHHPSRPEHPDFDLGQRLLSGGGGVLSFEVAGGGDQAQAVVDRLSLFSIGPSLGGVHSLATWPAGVTHAGMDDAARRRAGVAPGLIRLSVGLEPVEALWADLQQALQDCPPQ